MIDPICIGMWIYRNIGKKTVKKKIPNNINTKGKIRSDDND